jgi:manganese/zinc/iron transport system permease protein
MDYNTLIVLVGLVSTGLLLGSFGALVSLRGENLTADVAGHGVVSGVVLSQGVMVWLGLGTWLAVPVLWTLGFASSALILGFIFFLRWRGYSVGASQALAIALAYGSSLALLSVVQATGAFSTKGLTLLLLGDAATLTLGKVLPALLLLVVWALAFLLLRRALHDWVLDRHASGLAGMQSRLDLVWVLATVALLLSALPALGLTLLVGMLTLPALIVRPWVTSFTGLVLGSALVGGLVSGVAGWLSAGVLPLPTGALVVVSLGVVWALGSLAAGLRRKGVPAR